MLTVGILFIAIGKKICAIWNSPVYMCGIFWIFYVLISYVLMHKRYSFGMLGIAWIYIVIFIMFIAEHMGKSVFSITELQNNENIWISDQSWTYLKICSILGILAFFYQIKLYGFRLNNFISIDSLAHMNNLVAVARYSGKGIVNSLTQLLLIFVYAAPACGGFSTVYADTTEKKIWSYGSLIPSILLVLFLNTKAVIIGAGILWVSTFLISYYLKYKRSPDIKVKNILILLIIGGIFFLFMIVSMILRMGEVSQYSFMIAQRKIIVWIFGEVQSFDWWCSNVRILDYKFGAATYLGLANTLGIAEKIQGVYTSYSGTASNVYTAFRGVIEDYGYLFGAVYLFIKAFVGGCCFSYIGQATSIKVFSIVYLVAELFFLLFGAFVSPWTYMSYILAMVFFGIYLIVASMSNIKFVFGRRR